MKAPTEQRTKKKTTYSNEYPDQAYKLCLLGCTEREITSFFGICRSTFTNWKKNHLPFADALQRGQKKADMEVAVSLYSATVDRVITTKQAIKCKEVYYDDNGKRVEKERIEVVEVDKHLPADFRSQQFWLRNRNPRQWNEKYDEGEDAAPKGVTLNLGSGHNPLDDETVS
jgi:hypothetical protein